MFYQNNIIHLVAATKTALFAATKTRPGSRVLDGRFLVEPIGMGVANGRESAAVAYVGKFVQNVKAEGVVRSAIDRAGLLGVSVAPR